MNPTRIFMLCRLNRRLSSRGLRHSLRREYHVSRDEYDKIARDSLVSTEDSAFWLDYARDSLSWFTKPEVAVNTSNMPYAKWFPDGSTNLTVNALDRWVERGHGDRVAVHYESMVGGNSRDITYSELLEQVSNFAAALVNLDVQKGDRVREYVGVMLDVRALVLYTYYTVVVMFHYYWCIRKLWSSSILIYNNNIIAQHIASYSQYHVFLSSCLPTNRS